MQPLQNPPIQILFFHSYVFIAVFRSKPKIVSYKNYMLKIIKYKLYMKRKGKDILVYGSKIHELIRKWRKLHSLRVVKSRHA
jgi:hypothetical protein